MNLQTVNTNTKANCCPHGLPVGMCPICSGMSGGVKKSGAKSQKANEWSYAKCYAFWQRTLAQKAQKVADAKAAAEFQQNIAIFQSNIRNLIHKLDISIATLSDRLPTPLAKTLNILSQKVLIPILKLLEKMPNDIQKVIQEFPKIMADISDKLAAIFGELKLNINKKFEKAFKKIKKSLISLLAIFGMDMQDDEEKKIEEAKRILELKILKQNMQRIKEGKYE